jgi:MFS family permease
VSAGAGRTGLVAQMSSLSWPFWMANLMEMLERLAYYGVRVVIPIYIAQADEAAGLHFTQEQKGTIFMLWALVQTGVPVFSGGFADRYGYKRTIAASIAVKMCGYLLMATQRDFWPFTFGCMTLALGTAVFKPGVQGTLARTLTPATSSVGWGTFYMLVNVGGFLGPPLAHFLYGWSWPTVFYGCAAIVSLNFLVLLTYRAVPAGGDQGGGPLRVAARTFRNLAQARLLAFIAVMSGFWLTLMQLYDTMPNFIVDWVDSRALVEALRLPAMFTSRTARGTLVAQEWMINVDSAVIVLGAVVAAWLVARMRRVHAIVLGAAVTSLGLLAAGATRSGALCVLGIAVLAVGEMVAAPKMSDYLALIAPDGEKALYMGYSNLPVAVGWAYGSRLGGRVYEEMGDKANLALRWLAENRNITGVERTGAVARLQEVLGVDAAGATQLLWDAYRPWRLWLPLCGIGLLSALGVLLYARWVRDREAPGV